MKVFFLDIASHDGFLACITDDVVTASVKIEHPVRDHNLIPLVEQCLKKASWTYDDLTHIACVTGPGGFTSLRIGVAFANTVMSQKAIPGVGVLLCDLYGARISDQSVIWLHSTKKDQIFVHKAGESAEPTMMTLDKAFDEVSPGGKYCGELLPDHERALCNRGAKMAKLLPLESILPAFLQKQHYQSTILLPWYGRNW